MHLPNHLYTFSFTIPKEEEKEQQSKLKNKQTETGAHYKTLYTCTLAYSHQLNKCITAHQQCPGQVPTPAQF